MSCAADEGTLVLIADDRPITRYGFRRFFEHQSDRFEVAEAADGESVLQQVRALNPELVVLDLHLPTPRGTSSLCRAVIATSATTRILLCTAFVNVDEISECLAAGAQGCILKGAEIADFATAIARIESGETVLDPRVAEHLATRYTMEMRHEGDGRLNNREHAVLRLLGAGFSNRQIAGRLSLSEHTVKGYVTSLLRKLGARSRLEAVVMATRAGLLTPREGHGVLTPD